MHVTMIAAMARNRVIGTGSGKIPWNLPRDRAQFRSFSDGKHLLLGRVTYEEMSGWFTNQTPIILTNDVTYRSDEAKVVHRVDEAISVASEMGAPELAVCGGARVYEAALPYTDDLFLTLIEAEVEGSVFFPDFEEAISWELISEESFQADAENKYPMTFRHLRRSHPSSLRPSRMHLL